MTSPTRKEFDVDRRRLRQVEVGSWEILDVTLMDWVPLPKNMHFRDDPSEHYVKMWQEG